MPGLVLWLMLFRCMRVTCVPKTSERWAGSDVTPDDVNLFWTDIEQDCPLDAPFSTEIDHGCPLDTSLFQCDDAEDEADMDEYFKKLENKS